MGGEIENLKTAASTIIGDFSGFFCVNNYA